MAQWEGFGYPEEVVEFDEGTVDVGAWVTGHPALDAGVVLHNGAFGHFYFGVPRVLALDLDHVAIDGSLHKAPYGGEGTGKSPVDRAKLGWKWSLAVDAKGIPIG